MLSCINLSLTNNLGVVFSGLGFTALPGSFMAIRGKNGSGKTSLLKMILGKVDCGEGVIKWNNIDINEDINLFRENVCYIGHENALCYDDTVLENLKFWCRFRGEKELLAPAISYFLLADFLDIKVSLLSAGLRRRVELAKLLLYRTYLWLLDEPEVNLDDFSQNLLMNLLKIRVREGGVVMMVTHGFKEIKAESCFDITSFGR